MCFTTHESSKDQLIKGSVYFSLASFVPSPFKPLGELSPAVSVTFSGGRKEYRGKLLFLFFATVTHLLKFAIGASSFSLNEWLQRGPNRN